MVGNLWYLCCSPSIFRSLCEDVEEEEEEEEKKKQKETFFFKLHSYKSCLKKFEIC